MMLTAKRLRKLLHYDPKTGIFRWRVESNRADIGDVAGCIVRPKGPRVIGVDDGRYRANRLALLYMTGKWPKREVNYLNHNASDTRWANLREMTPSVRRRRARTTNKLGVKGVWKTKSGRYVAQIKKAGIRIYFGSFDTIKEAGAAYTEMTKRIFGKSIGKK